MKLRKFKVIHRICFCLCVCVITLCISSLFNWDNSPITGLDKLLGDTLITLFCLFLIHRLNITKNTGFQRKGFLKGILLGIPFYVIGLLSLFISNPSIDWSTMKWNGNITLVLFSLNMLFVGINEEILMRSLVFTYLEDGYGNDKKPAKNAIVISAIIFGVIHLPNILFMDPLVVLAQVANAMSAGVLFAVIFSKTRNIWANIVIHTIVDFISLFIENCFTGGNSILSIQLSVITTIIIIIAGSLPPLVIALIYERKINQR